VGTEADEASGAFSVVEASLSVSTFCFLAVGCVSLAGSAVFSPSSSVFLLCSDLSCAACDSVSLFLFFSCSSFVAAGGAGFR